MKKFLTLAVVLLASLALAACNSDSSGLKVVKQFSAEDMGSWTGSITPDETAFGTATYNAEGDFTVIRVGDESWGWRTISNSNTRLKRTNLCGTSSQRSQ